MPITLFIQCLHNTARVTGGDGGSISFGNSVESLPHGGVRRPVLGPDKDLAAVAIISQCSSLTSDITLDVKIDEPHIYFVGPLDPAVRVMHLIAQRPIISTEFTLSSWGGVLGSEIPDFAWAQFVMHRC